MADNLSTAFQQPTPLHGSVPGMPPLFFEEQAGRHRLCVEAGTLYDVLAKQPNRFYIEWFYQQATAGGFQYGDDYWFTQQDGCPIIWMSLDMAIGLAQAHKGAESEQVLSYLSTLRSQMALELCGPCEADDQFISTVQADTLQDLARAEFERTKAHPLTVWAAFQKHFQVNSYRRLPANRFDEARAYFEAREKAQLAHAATAEPPTSTQNHIWFEYKNLYQLCELKGLKPQADRITVTAVQGLLRLLAS